ncbi:vomeronasal type-2 receptor 26-like [Tiliqua scincoides]|uniref:vomeronasal type-2 receptor 26-like n=1 Tax=Tiliqua scincoides TaxID=71010 RepID=UPI0034618141
MTAAGVPRLLLLLLVPVAWGGLKAKCPQSVIREQKELLNYYRPGDYLLGGAVSTNLAFFQPRPLTEPPSTSISMKGATRNWLILSFLFATEKINQDPRLLPNVTLGYNIYDTYSDAQVTSDALVDLLSTGETRVPNYSCGRQRRLLAVLEGAEADLSSHISAMLTAYKIPQVSYAFTARGLNDRTRSPFFYRMVPKEPQYVGVVGLLLHFQWSWVALVAADTDNGERFIRTLTPLLTQSSICVAYSQSISGLTTGKVLLRKESLLKERQVNVFLYYAETGSFVHVMFVIQREVEFLIKPKVGKIWITTAFWDISLELSFSRLSFQHIQGLFSFSIQSMKRINYNGFGKLLFTWQRLVEGGFHCSFPKPVLSVKGWTRCRERPQPLPWDVMERALTQDSYAIHSAVQAVAQALHAASSSRIWRRVVEDGGSLEVPRVQAWQLHPFLRNFGVYNTSLDGVYLDGDGDLAADFDIVNWVVFPNKSVVRVTIGSLARRHSPPGLHVTIDQGAIEWPGWFNQTLPQSRCTDSCRPGYSKLIQEGRPLCCYVCARCAEGTVSSQEDADHCDKCPEDQHPNKAQTQCVPKVITFLSYEDYLGALLTSSALVFSLTTGLVLGAFIKHHSDRHSQPGQIVLQCNAGSVSLFYGALGYLGFLAAVCFTGAFLARRLPGAFNEAKLLTFSMLALEWEERRVGSFSAFSVVGSSAILFHFLPASQSREWKEGEAEVVTPAQLCLE